VQRGCQGLEPRHILSLPGGCPGLGLALNLAGREHGTGFVVDRRGPPRVGILGVLGPHVGTGQAFAHPGLGGEFTIGLQDGVEWAAVDACLQILQTPVELDDLLIRHKIGHGLRFLHWQMLDLGLQRRELALAQALALFPCFTLCR
jgi:hypothetical protein